MALTFNKRKKVKMCYERLGLLVLGGITTVIVLHGYPAPALEDKEQRKITFDINDDGVVVVLDIANTGTDSLANYMIKNAILEPPCRCKDGLTKCKCLNKQGQPWLFHAFNTTGYVCGEHADFTTLTNCPIDYWFRSSGGDSRTSRQYLLITMIRDPLTRYVSQWRSFTQEDIFFRNEPRLFRTASVELQKKGLACYVGKQLSALSLQDFLSCSENGAINLQTRMLANITFVDSLGLTGKAYQEAMLNSAKQTLQMLPFFGLFSRPNDSLKLLESTLGFQFKQPLNFEDPSIQDVFPLPVSLQQQILQVNNLDVRLDQYARYLFQERVKAVRFPGLRSDNSAIENLGDNDKISTENLGENDKIIYRPDLNTRIDVAATADITFDNERVSLNNNFLVKDKNINIDNEVADDRRDKYDADTKQDVVMQESTRMVANEDNDEKDNDQKKKIDTNEDERVIKGEVNHLPDLSENRVEIEDESTNYNPDVEDVFVFLSRLDKIKQQQNKKDFTQTQKYSFPQKPLPQRQQMLPQKTPSKRQLQQKPLPQSQQMLPQKTPSQRQLQQKPQMQSQNQLMYRQAKEKPGIAAHTQQNSARKIKTALQGQTFGRSENVLKSGSVHSQRDMKLYQSYILADPTKVNTPKLWGSPDEKGVDRMLI